MTKAFKCDSCGSFSTEIPWYITIAKPYHITETKEYEVCNRCMLTIKAVLSLCESGKENDNE